MLTRTCYHNSVPKLIDHVQRQEDLAEATWRVILREGISGVSIRTVAAEAGVSTGSLRHVFPSRIDLLVHAMRLVDQRASERIQAHFVEPNPRTLVLAVISELLPLDAQRRAEMEVNIALIAEAPANDRIRQVRDDAYEVLRNACRRMATHLAINGSADSSLNIEEETTTLHALIDGLAVHMLINDNRDFDRQAQQIIGTHVDSLR